MSSTPALNLLSKDGEVFYFASVFAPDESARLFDSLLREIEFRQEPIMIYGKSVMQPRLTAWVGDANADYGYSGVRLRPLTWTKSATELRVRVEQVAQCKFNSALFNLYRDGRDSMGWHRDNEPELGVNPVIASVTFGARRTFQLRHRLDKTLKVSIELEAGSLLLMKGETQHKWEHGVPKRMRLQEPRLNVTFRRIGGRK